MNSQAVSLFAGRARQLPDDSRRSGIYKQAVVGPATITFEGIVGDEQADRRVHGGPEKALHAYPAVHFAAFAVRFPEAAALLRPGSIGENVSLPEADESQVCIGDVFALGSARLQVSQPRQPCWKIDARFGVSGLTALVAETGRTGWYFRVLDEGTAESGDALMLVERAAGAVSVASFWQTWSCHRPAPEALVALAEAAGLNPKWRERLHERARYLANLPPAAKGEL